MRSLQDTVNRWETNAAGAQTAYQQGVSSTQVDVMGRAIASAAVAVRQYAAVVGGPAWPAAIQASGGTANWKAQSVAKAGHYGTGISDGKTKFSAAMAKLLPALEQITNGLQPRQPGNIAANVNNRVLAIDQALHARKGEFKG